LCPGGFELRGRAGSGRILREGTKGYLCLGVIVKDGRGYDNKWALHGDLVTPLGRFSFRGRRAAEQPERPSPEEARAQFDAAWESLGERARRREREQQRGGAGQGQKTGCGGAEGRRRGGAAAGAAADAASGSGDAASGDAVCATPAVKSAAAHTPLEPLQRSRGCSAEGRSRGAAEEDAGEAESDPYVREAERLMAQIDESLVLGAGRGARAGAGGGAGSSDGGRDGKNLGPREESEGDGTSSPAGSEDGGGGACWARGGAPRAEGGAGRRRECGEREGLRRRQLDEAAFIAVARGCAGG
jgi:single-strand DNA-binding protein